MKLFTSTCNLLTLNIVTYQDDSVSVVMSHLVGAMVTQAIMIYYTRGISSHKNSSLCCLPHIMSLVETGEGQDEDSSCTKCEKGIGFFREEA